MIQFGTAGIRGVMPDEMNVETVRIATQGLANHLVSQGSVLIGYDSRHNSKLFAEEAAGVLLANGITVYLFDEIRPVPLLSFGCRHLKTSAGIMITASHNPPEYNGYKVYGSHGGQIVSPEDRQIVAEVEKINNPDQIEVAPLDGVIRIGEEIDDAYFQATDKMRSKSEGRGDLHIVYTPLHGAGITVIPRALRHWGFTHLSIVEAQSSPDGRFPTVKVPNPEEPEALSIGIAEMERLGADLLLATDPDADRVGVALPGGVILNGNEIAVLCLDYLTRREWPEPVGVAKSVVTTELFRKIAEDRGWHCEDLLTGFKYFGQLIDRWQAEDSFRYLFGAEESYGSLLGTHARDKDAVIACQLLAEVALEAKQAGETLPDRLYALYEKFGIYREKVVAIRLKGDPMARLRVHPPTSIAGEKVVRVEDYLKPLIGSKTQSQGDLDGADSRMSSAAKPLMASQRAKHRKWAIEVAPGEEFLAQSGVKPSGLPPADVLIFRLEGGDSLIVRPSGTEPKIKLYCGARSSISVEECDQRADRLLSALREEMNL